jgi:hypothetical protein
MIASPATMRGRDMRGFLVAKRYGDEFHSVPIKRKELVPKLDTCWHSFAVVLTCRPTAYS